MNAVYSLPFSYFTLHGLGAQLFRFHNRLFNGLCSAIPFLYKGESGIVHSVEVG